MRCELALLHQTGGGLGCGQLLLASADRLLADGFSILEDFEAGYQLGLGGGCLGWGHSRSGVVKQ